MQIKFGKGKFNNKLYFVFRDEDEASRYEWLFITVFRMRYRCFGNYMNAFGYP